MLGMPYAYLQLEEHHSGGTEILDSMSFIITAAYFK